MTVYPSGPTVPENLLRIELRFAEPLKKPFDARHVKLFDSHGERIDDAFLDLSLGDANGTSATLLLHPARVKSGVGANRLLGRALQAGALVSLVIDDPAIAKPVRKIWQVVAPDTKGPDPASWALEAPMVGSRAPLVVRLYSAVSSTARNLIAVRDANGGRVEGSAVLDSSETVWRFFPRRPWARGPYALVTSPDLEDPAGNPACSRFEMPQNSAGVCELGAGISFVTLERKLNQ